MLWQFDGSPVRQMQNCLADDDPGREVGARIERKVRHGHIHGACWAGPCVRRNGVSLAPKHECHVTGEQSHRRAYDGIKHRPHIGRRLADHAQDLSRGGLLLQRLAAVSVLSPQKINTQLATIDVHCFGDSTGKIAATTTGGILPYKFNWSNGATTSAIANLKAQKYVFTITDANGCVKMDSATLRQNSQIILSPSSDSVKCFSGTNGTARVSVTGGQAPYNYRWANNALDSFIKNVSAGIYSVSVTDGSGCSTALNVPVFQPLLLKIDSVVATPKMCYNVNNGQAKVFASGGTKNYVYNWSNGQNSVTATNLSSGKIKVTVTDVYSCTVNDTSFIKSPDSISGYFTATPITCNGSSTGSLKINATGGTGNFNYIWSTNPKQTNSSISKLPSENVKWLS